MAIAPLTSAASAHDIDESQIPGTVQLVDLDEHIATRHARGHKDIILVPTPSADPDDPLNWSPGRKRLALICILACAFFPVTFESLYKQGILSADLVFILGILGLMVWLCR